MFSVAAQTAIYYFASAKIRGTIKSTTSIYANILNGRSNLDGSIELAGRQKAANEVRTEAETSVLEQKEVFFYLSEGMKYLDGGGPRYFLDGRLVMASEAVMDGFSLNGTFNMGPLAYFNELENRLDGSLTLDSSLKLDGSREMEQHEEPHHTLRLEEWQGGKLTERRWL